MDEQRVARTVAVGAVSAIAIGAVFGVTAGQMNGGGTPVAQESGGEGLEVLFHDRADRPSRGLSRSADQAAPITARAQAPVLLPSQPQGPPAAPLPPIPEDCEEYSGNRQIGCALLSEFGFGLDQMPALDALWTKESGWNHLAQNPSSGAYGIPQALPGNKMASVAADWETNPATQIAWGLSYISGRYGTPCNAYQFSQANGYY